jgi:hypothetical protein
MANNIPFQSMGKTYQANASTVSTTITITPDGVCNQLLVASHESTGGTGKPVYFRVSNASNVTVTAPSAGNAQYAFVAIPCTIKSYTVPFQFSPSAPLYVAFITESGTAECYFTPGEGV